MWKASVIVVLLALGAVALASHHHSSLRDKVIEYRVHSQNLHIDHLEHEVDELEHDFGELSRPITPWDVSMLTTRVGNNEGKPC